MKDVLFLVGFTILISILAFARGVEVGFEHVENKLNVSILDVKNSLKECEESLIYRNESCVVVFDIVKQSELKGE